VGQRILRTPLLGRIPCHFREAAQLSVLLFETHQNAIGPEPRTVFSKMKTPIKRPAFIPGCFDFPLDFSCFAIIPRKNNRTALTDCFLLSPPKDPLRPRAPESNDILA